MYSHILIRLPIPHRDIPWVTIKRMNMQPILLRPTTQPPHLIRKPLQLINTQLTLILPEKYDASFTNHNSQITELLFGIGGV